MELVMNKKTQITTASCLLGVSVTLLAAMIYLADVFPRTVHAWAGQGRPLSTPMASLGDLSKTLGPYMLVLFTLLTVVSLVWLAVAIHGERNEPGNATERPTWLKVMLASLSAWLTLLFSLFVYGAVSYMLIDNVFTQGAHNAQNFTVWWVAVWVAWGLGIISAVVIAKWQHRLLAHRALRTNYIVLATLAILTLFCASRYVSPQREMRARTGSSGRQNLVSRESQGEAVKKARAYLDDFKQSGLKPVPLPANAQMAGTLYARDYSSNGNRIDFTYAVVFSGEKSLVLRGESSLTVSPNGSCALTCMTMDAVDAKDLVAMLSLHKKL